MSSRGVFRLLSSESTTSVLSSTGSDTASSINCLVVTAMRLTEKGGGLSVPQPFTTATENKMLSASCAWLLAPARALAPALSPVAARGSKSTSRSKSKNGLRARLALSCSLSSIPTLGIRDNGVTGSIRASSDGKAHHRGPHGRTWITTLGSDPCGLTSAFRPR